MGSLFEPPGGPVEPLDPERLEQRLREAARSFLPDRLVDDLELRHLIRVVTEGALLLGDVYDEERLARIFGPDRGALIRRLLEDETGGAEVLSRLRRLPEEVRLLGDKALFDLGIRGLRRVRGHDLVELGSRAYRTAGQILEMLAEDRRLREFFKQNRLLVLPLEEEVTFLHQCSEKVPFYADLLKRMQDPEARAGAPSVEILSAAAEALGSAPHDAYAEAARSGAAAEPAASRESLLSSYERMLLFASLDLERLQRALSTVVVDQPDAVGALLDEFGLFAAGTRDPRKPAAYFLVGPTGVGKNHLVESLCRLLEGVWGIEVPLLTLEGPNYTYPSDINELRGATRGFIRSDEEGLLTSFHERASRAPLSVILVDEVEKAHPQLQKFFLSILDRGTTTDNRGKVLSFANTLIFFTSNLGYSDRQQSAAPIGYRDEEARRETADRDVRRDVRKGLSPEFANRLRLVHFRRLTRASAERILDLELERIAARYRDLHGIGLVLDPTAREELLRRGFSAEDGARRLTAVLESACNVDLARKIRRDDRGPAPDRDALVAWLREVRAGGRAYDPVELRGKVLEATRARTGYASIRIAFRDEAFVYDPEGA